MHDPIMTPNEILAFLKKKHEELPTHGPQEGRSLVILTLLVIEQDRRTKGQAGRSYCKSCYCLLSNYLGGPEEHGPYCLLRPQCGEGDEAWKQRYEGWVEQNNGDVEDEEDEPLDLPDRGL